MFSNLRFGRTLSYARASAPGFAIPTLEAFDGASTTGNTVTLTGAIAGDLLLGVDSSTSATPPATVATGATWIGSGVGSAESGGNCAIRAAYKIAAGADEVVAAAGSSRRVWVALRGVDTANFASFLSAGVTFAYVATTGSNLVVPALGTFPRNGIVLTWQRYTGTTNYSLSGLTLILRQNPGSTPNQAYWTGASNTLDSAGIEVASYSGESVAITSTEPRAAFSIWIPGAPS